MAAHYDEVLRLWDIETGKVLLRLEGHVGSPLSVAFTADGGHAVSGGTDGTVRLWRLEGPPRAAWRVKPVGRAQRRMSTDEQKRR